MKRLFKVGDKVLATIRDFEPFPANVEGVRLNEADCSVFYYVRLEGSSDVLPLDAENLQPWEESKNKSKWKKGDSNEFNKERQRRVDAILGGEDEIPEVLMNFVTVDSDFEEVSESTIRRLGLCSIMLTPSMVDRLDKNIVKCGENSEDNEFVDVEDIDEDNPAHNILKKTNNSGITCICRKKFKTKRALKAHKKRSLLCSNADFRKTVRMEQMKAHTKKTTECEESSVNTQNADESGMQDKSKWSIKSASGFYHCKLCFRKFRSKGEVQLHMSLHKSNQVVKRTPGNPRPNFNESEDSMSVEDDDESKLDKHCSMERIRRAELADKLAGLAATVGLRKGTSKAETLIRAKKLIDDLERESIKQKKLLSFLQDENYRLRAQCTDLPQEER